MFGAEPAVVDWTIQNTVPLLVSILKTHQALKVGFPNQDRD